MRTHPMGRTRRSMALLTTALLGLAIAGCTGTAAPRPTRALTTTSIPAGMPSIAPQLALALAVQPGAESRAVIDAATSTLRREPGDADALLSLGLAWYQHARETADPTDYARADEAFDRRLSLLADDPEALIGKGTVALARHRFADALELGQRAANLAPASGRAAGVVADALLELGRYPEALDAVQRMVDLRPDLSSYSRVSYQRELRGDLDGAIDAMERAVIAGGPYEENTGYVRVLLGNLWFLQGGLDRAEASYEGAVASSPGFVPAIGGLARVRAARGDLEGAIELYTQAVDLVPFPDLLIALGEAQEALGRLDEADATYQLVRQVEALFASNGVSTDLDLALFEADHGDPRTALGLAQRAYQETPTVRAADALGWALHQAGRSDEARPLAERALSLGSVEPSYLFHAGMIAAAQGDADAARAWLVASGSRNPAWSALRAPIATRTLAGLPTTRPVDDTEVAR